MSNILTHNRNTVEINVCKRDYWDFHLTLPITSINTATPCQSVDIDFSDSDCVWFDSVRSKTVWGGAINKGVKLENIGYTGVDNGLVSYEVDRITNKEFIERFLYSEYSIDEDEKYLLLNKVSGNHKIYDYSLEITDEDNLQVSKLNGGFYQGFFKTNDNEYQTLPDKLENGWTISVELKPADLRNDKTVLNDVYPENKGIFLYIGTRAENKWWYKYNTSEGAAEYNGWYGDDGYATDYFSDETDSSRYLTDLDNKNYSDDGYFSDDYLTSEGVEEKGFESEYFKDDTTGEDNTVKYVEEGYLEDDININPSMILKTKEGYDVSQPNIVEIETDNKFIFFNHTKDGFTTDTWKDDEKIILHTVKKPKTENFFTMFHHGKGGYTTDTIKPLLDELSRNYDVFADLYRNAIAFQITDDGRVGYKYAIKDCETNSPKIESEFSDIGAVKKNEWQNITVKLAPEKQTKGDNSTMRLFFYVDGCLRLVSKELPVLKLRKLDDVYSKQEGVPYNISIGGGTQGLCEVVYPDFRNEPSHRLFLEKEFAGSFIGYIKNFKFFNCLIISSDSVRGC